MTAPKPPGGELSRSMLAVVIQLWNGDRRLVIRETLRALERRGLVTMRGELGQHLLYPKLTPLGEQRAYWCQRGRLP